MQFHSLTYGLILSTALFSGLTHAQMNINMSVDEPTAKKFTEGLSGGIGKSREEAFKSWESRCEEWKADVKQLNGKQLISVSCGVYEYELMHEYYANKEYRVKSLASYTVRIPAKNKK